MIAPRTLEDWQDAIEARLLGDEWLADVAILKEQLSSTTDADGGVTAVEDIDTRILNALTAINERAGKMGACVVLAMPSLEDLSGNVSGIFGSLIVSCRVIVNPLLNNDAIDGTRKSEGQIASRVALLLQHFGMDTTNTPLSEAASGLLALRDIKPINDELPEGHNGYDVALFCKTGVAAGAKVEKPTITIDTGTATLATSTGGATIRYTINGGSPSAGNASATTYSAPFAVESGDIIRAAASLADYFESDTRITKAP